MKDWARRFKALFFLIATFWVLLHNAVPHSHIAEHEHSPSSHHHHGKNDLGHHHHDKKGKETKSALSWLLQGHIDFIGHEAFLWTVPEFSQKPLHKTFYQGALGNASLNFIGRKRPILHRLPSLPNKENPVFNSFLKNAFSLRGPPRI